MSSRVDLGQFGVDFGFTDDDFARVSGETSRVLAGIALGSYDRAVVRQRFTQIARDDDEIVRYAALMLVGFVRVSGIQAMFEMLGAPEGIVAFDETGQAVDMAAPTNPEQALGFAFMQATTAMAKHDVGMTRDLILGQPDRHSFLAVVAEQTAAVMRSGNRREG